MNRTHHLLFNKTLVLLKGHNLQLSYPGSKYLIVRIKIVLTHIAAFFHKTGNFNLFVI